MANMLSDRQRGMRLGLLVGAWLIVVAPMVAAQTADSRWAPWVGCWRAVGETGTAPVLCMVPLAGEAAIEMLTVVDGQVVSRESIFTDGRQHGVSREECEGWEGAEFSADSHRIYVRSELNCAAGSHRSSTGVMSMVSPFEWLDVRTMDVDGQSVPWAIRYRIASQADFEAAGQEDLFLAQGSEVRMARMLASIPIAVDDVIEAARRVSAETLQLWVVERGEPFALDASRLIEMADAGVPPGVIDVVVAVSYPEKFVVNERLSAGPRPGEAVGGRSSLGYGRGLSPFEDPFYDPYSRYGYYSHYGSRYPYGLGYYGVFGYGPGFSLGYGYGYGGYGSGFGGYYGFGGYSPPIVVVGRRGAGPTAGRVVRGGGYTSAGGSGESTGRSARPRSSGSSRSAAPAARSARPGSSRSAAPAARSARPRSSGGGSVTRSAAPSRSPATRSSPRSSGRSARPRAGRGN